MKPTKPISGLLLTSAGLLLSTQLIIAQHYTAGHADIGVGFEDDGSGYELHPHWHTHTGAVIDGTPAMMDGEYEAGDLTAVVPASREFVAPTDATFNTPSGVAAGDSYWSLPQGSVTGVPFLGIGAEELDPLDWNGDVTFELGTVVSPSGTGDFSLYQFDGGYNFFWSSADAGSNVGVDMTPGSHDHFTWVFSETGDWSIEITVSGDYIGSATTTGAYSTTETFGFQVVPEPSAYAAILGMAMLGLVLARRRTRA